MKAIGLIFTVALAMALAITLVTMKNTAEESVMKNDKNSDSERGKILMPSKRLSRFLAQKPKPKNPRAADHCKKHNDICGNIPGEEGRNSTCCNNKCVDLVYDAYNCGACKNKCLPFEACCNGRCVNLSFDKRHCGFCNKKCMPGGYCIYGICDYA
ncbi:unnamed protein product [Coffea canephora]|uniref:Stigma-specific STIG1-like protein 1 n=1 Tax=Coffea canephora TaxID=49390 RepID=A0A068V1P5_COFCA|nr:unnamed protein product [Coffea canephora]